MESEETALFVAQVSAAREGVFLEILKTNDKSKFQVTSDHVLVISNVIEGHSGAVYKVTMSDNDEPGSSTSMPGMKDDSASPECRLATKGGRAR